jgi:hypothetical protein
MHERRILLYRGFRYALIVRLIVRFIMHNRVALPDS